MVTLEQVKLLESKVGKALSYIETLSSENATLREKLDGYRRVITSYSIHYTKLYEYSSIIGAPG